MIKWKGRRPSCQGKTIFTVPTDFLRAEDFQTNQALIESKRNLQPRPSPSDSNLHGLHDLQVSHVMIQITARSCD